MTGNIWSLALSSRPFNFIGCLTGLSQKSLPKVSHDMPSVKKWHWNVLLYYLEKKKVSLVKYEYVLKILNFKSVAKTKL